MSSAPWATDRTLRSRFECKYLVTEEMATEIRRHVAPFVRPDYFTERSPGNRYPVHSLYLDTPRLELYETTCQGMKNRFKLRIRGYDGKPDSPLFAEVKRKADRVILKRRALISRPDAMALLRGGRVETSSTRANPEFAEFRSLAARLGARPTVGVSYLREAHEAVGAEPVRLTFDRALRNAAPDARRPFAFDHHDWDETPCDKVILELKYTDACPHWIEGLVQRFRLDRCSVAKYILCMDAFDERTAVLHRRSG
jgi:hypothetical protein